MKTILIGAVAALALVGCQSKTSYNNRDRGVGGSGRYETTTPSTSEQYQTSQSKTTTEDQTIAGKKKKAADAGTPGYYEPGATGGSGMGNDVDQNTAPQGNFDQGQSTDQSGTQPQRGNY